MTYLAIMVLVAAAGILRLWMMQRRERTSLESADTFWAGLERIGAHVDARTRAERPPARGRFRRKTGAGLDPARRSAAKKRIEARRRALAKRASTRRRTTRQPARASAPRPRSGAKRTARGRVPARTQPRAAGRATTERSGPRPQARKSVSAEPRVERARTLEPAYARAERSEAARLPDRVAPPEIDLRDGGAGHVLIRWPDGYPRGEDHTREPAVR